MLSAVNFGVVALARATRTPADSLLSLRCECGAPACRSKVSISIVAYEAALLTGCLLVAPAHGNGARVIDRSRAWSIIDGSPPAADGSGAASAACS